MLDYQKEFIEFALRHQVLRFGAFTLKSGRASPYFFNAGLFNSGAALAKLGEYYARTIEGSGIPYDMLFGPAYKGIGLAASAAIALAQRHGRDVPYCFNRKEAKAHGEGGETLGAPLAGRVLIVDDVISAGTSVSQAVAFIRAAGAVPVCVVIALDRQERGGGTLSAVEEVRQRYGIDVASVIDLDALLEYLRGLPGMHEHLTAVQSYRARYGV
ncbi:MAG: orotate phosphoribosyltransferase [Chromatiales bacterium]